MTVLKACALKKFYPDRGREIAAVRNVSLQVPAGEVLAFLGPNGAGKTVMLDESV